MNTGALPAVGSRSRALGDDIARIRLDSGCGLVVNVYVLERDGHVVLVDAGFPYTTGQLEEGLGELGLRLEDVDDVLYTHLHVDHVGGGVALKGRWSPREWLWEGAAPGFGDVYAYLDAIRSPPTWPAGTVPDPALTEPRVREMREKPRLPWRAGGDGSLTDPRGVAFGEVVACGPMRFRCVDGRGHGPHHVGWLLEGDRWLFCGDAIMSVPTPIVPAMGDDLKDWLRTVDRWSSTLDAAWLLPGHGMPTRLIEPSYQRSLATWVRLYEGIDARLSGPGVVDALTLVHDVLPGDRSRYAARSAVTLSNAAALLGSLAADELLSEVEPGRFVDRPARPREWSSWRAQIAPHR